MKLRLVFPGAVLLALTACAPVRIKGNSTLLSAQAAREQALAPRTYWSIEARLAVSDGHHGGSGSLTWVQDGASYDFILRAPVTGRSFSLHGGPAGAVLKGLDRGPVRGPDAQRLLDRALGWQVPLAQLRYWIMGARAPGSPAHLRFGDNRLPSLLQQDGWKVEYRDWYTRLHPSLPRRVFASRGPYRVRVSIRSWSLK